MIEKFSETTFVNTKIGGAATVDELENVAEILASKIEELIDENEKLKEAIRYIALSLGANKSYEVYKELKQEIESIIN